MASKKKEKKVKKDPCAGLVPRGTGKANKLLIKDFAGGRVTFRVETDVPRTPENANEFDAFVTLLEGGESSRMTRTTMTTFLTTQVDQLGGSPSEIKGAKNMILAAFDLL